MVSRSWAQHIVARGRRSRFFPAAMVDRVSDPVDTPALTQSVVVYFPTAAGTLYQIRPWFGPLRALDEVHPVVIICRDSRTAHVVRKESGLPCMSVGTDDQLDRLIGPEGPGLALYPNLDPLDFDCLRIATMVHAYIGHGDSDKAVFGSNQIKAFDRYLVAGEAAVERLDRALMLYDAHERCLIIGQPQTDGRQFTPPDPHTRPLVVYAPTWEGGQASQMYSSLVSHGEALVRQLLADGRYDVVYRPHPLTGWRDRQIGGIDASIRTLLNDAGHRVDTGPEASAAFDGASILITDVSAIISEWLPTGRPLLITSDAAASNIPVLNVADLDRAAEVVADALARPIDLGAVLRHHFAYSEPGAATQAFVEACSKLLDRRNEALSGDGSASPDAL